MAPCDNMTAISFTPHVTKYRGIGVSGNMLERVIPRYYETHNLDWKEIRGQGCKLKVARQRVYQYLDVEDLIPGNFVVTEMGHNTCTGGPGCSQR